MSAKLHKSTLAFFDMASTKKDLTDGVDLSSAALYLVGLQVIASILLVSIVGSLTASIQPPSQVSAVRSLALCTIVLFLMLRKPARIGNPRGVLVLFNALRPAAVIYLVFLVIEQLLHSCEHPTDAITSHLTFRRIIFHVATIIMVFAAFLRAYNPSSESDLSFLMTLAAILIIATVPPPSLALTGPLCGSPSTYDLLERLVRSLFYGALYSVHVYLKPPVFQLHEVSISVIRSAFASIWVLGCSPFFLICAPIQIGVAIAQRVKMLEEPEYENVRVQEVSDSESVDLEAANQNETNETYPPMEAQELQEEQRPRIGFQELPIGDLQPQEEVDYSGVVVEPTQLSSFVGVQRLVER